MKITTPPIPVMIPSANKSVKTPGGSVSTTQLLNEAKVLSIKSIGASAQAKLPEK
ncbi:hypothetical protein [Winogradskyella psychrotolerans]|uniref:hypothetical protein n=1 Tax=Winogradskyella psychrotolerans TaxID=1344585 RepID=UPI0029342ECE|nr:hypothetical protein [Winogradskyella psychrotolerans]